MNASCKRISKLLFLLSDHSLSAAKLSVVKEHLAVCADCRRELEAWRRIASAMSKLESPAPPADLASRVMARIEAADDTQSKKRYSWAWRKPFAPKSYTSAGEWLRTGMARMVATAAAIAIIACGSLGLAAKLAGSPLSLASRNPGQFLAQLTPQVETPSETPAEKPHEAQGTPVTPTEEPVVPEVGEQPAEEGSNPEQLVPEQPETSIASPLPEKNTAPEPETGVPPVTVAQNPAPPPYQPRAFLEKERQIISSFLKVQAGDITSAEAAAKSYARDAGARVEELARQQAPAKQQLGLKFTVDIAQANVLLVRLTSLGKVVSRETQTRDVTADFTNILQQYSYWVALRNSASDPSEIEAIASKIASLENQLSTWDEEAQRQVIVLWLEEK